MSDAEPHIIVLSCYLEPHILMAELGLRSVYDTCSFIWPNDLLCEIDKNHKSRIVVAIEPFLERDRYISISTVLKRFLADRFPDVKLVVIGTVKHSDPNYIDMLNPPESLAKFIDDAYPVNNMADVPEIAQDISQILASFLDGHGSASIVSRLNLIHMVLNVLYTHLDSDDFDTASEHWLNIRKDLRRELKEIHDRCDKRLPYLMMVPFLSDFDELRLELDLLSRAAGKLKLPADQLLDRRYDRSLTALMKLITQYDRKYIRPEHYEEAGSDH